MDSLSLLAAGPLTTIPFFLPKEIVIELVRKVDGSAPTSHALMKWPFRHLSSSLNLSEGLTLPTAFSACLQVLLHQFLLDGCLTLTTWQSCQHRAVPTRVPYARRHCSVVVNQKEDSVANFLRSWSHTNGPYIWTELIVPFKLRNGEKCSCFL